MRRPPLPATLVPEGGAAPRHLTRDLWCAALILAGVGGFVPRGSDFVAGRYLARLHFDPPALDGHLAAFMGERIDGADVRGVAAGIGRALTRLATELVPPDGRNLLDETFAVAERRLVAARRGMYAYRGPAFRQAREVAGGDFAPYHELAAWLAALPAGLRVLGTEDAP